MILFALFRAHYLAGDLFLAILLFRQNLPPLFEKLVKLGPGKIHVLFQRAWELVDLDIDIRRNSAALLDLDEQGLATLLFDKRVQVPELRSVVRQLTVGSVERRQRAKGQQGD